MCVCVHVCVYGREDGHALCVCMGGRGVHMCVCVHERERGKERDITLGFMHIIMIYFDRL